MMLAHLFSYVLVDLGDMVDFYTFLDIHDVSLPFTTAIYLPQCLLIPMRLYTFSSKLVCNACNKLLFLLNLYISNSKTIHPVGI